MNSHSSSQRAENEVRTRDPDLGKVVLYQLSYFRNKKMMIISEEEETRTPTTQLSLPPQSSASTNSATSPKKTNTYVPRTGLEPARLSTLAPETSASTIPPPGHVCYLSERKTRLELATPTLARSCSTN